MALRDFLGTVGLGTSSSYEGGTPTNDNDNNTHIASLMPKPIQRRFVAAKVLTGCAAVAAGAALSVGVATVAGIGTLPLLIGFGVVYTALCAVQAKHSGRFHDVGKSKRRGRSMTVWAPRRSHPVTRFLHYFLPPPIGSLIR